ncbi:MAG: TetR/AcrR family transcriptional regulator [Phycisphaeraceae bacterium]
MSKANPGRPCDPALAQRRREEILNAAITHFARFGFPHADLDAIAEEAGCAKGTLYRYFESKRDLFHQSVDYVMRGLLAATSSPDNEDPIRKIEHGVRAYLAYFDAHPQYIELLMQERAEFKDRHEPTYSQYRHDSREQFKTLLRELIRAGRFRRVSTDLVMNVVGNLLYGTIFTNHFAGRTKTLEEQADDVLDVLFLGLLSPDEANRRRRKH